MGSLRGGLHVTGRDTGHKWCTYRPSGGRAALRMGSNEVIQSSVSIACRRHVPYIKVIGND